jgi:hypothetical protein
MASARKFKKKATQYHLTWGPCECAEECSGTCGGEYEGLEVTMRSLDIEQFLEVTDMAAAAAEDAKLQAKNTRLIFSTFATALVEWNVTDEFERDVPPVLAQCTESGKALPLGGGRCADHQDADDRCVITGVMSQELDFVFMIFGRWQEAMGGVSGPLGSASSSGKQSLEASLPMDTSSPSRPS